MTAVIYARYSSDNQREESIEASNKGSTLLSQIQMFSPLFVHLQNIH